MNQSRNWAVLVLVGALLLELGSAGILKARSWSVNRKARKERSAEFRAFEELLEKEGIDNTVRLKELRELYKHRVELSPYRWYALPRGFRGRYYQTDGFGFRNEPAPERAGERRSIGFFGGSTMWGLYNTPEGTIPAQVRVHLNPAHIQTYNFGLGAYSSSAELSTFVEVVRLDYYGIKYAVFYDGVNEVGRYVEKLQDRSDSPMYDVVGYPFQSSWKDAAKRLVNARPDGYRPAFFRLCQRFWWKLARRGSAAASTEEESAVDRHSDAIYRIYLENVRDISAIARDRGIVPIFIWQPSLLSRSRRELAEYEVALVRREAAVRKYTDAVNAKIRKSRELSQFNFFDLSSAFDDLPGEGHFFDYCHTTDRANAHVAARIADILRKFLPSEDFAAIRQEVR